MSFQEIAKYLSKSSAFTDNTNNVSQMLHTMETINQASLRKKYNSFNATRRKFKHTYHQYFYLCMHHNGVIKS